MTDETKWGGVWTFGDITLPIEPALGMLVTFPNGGWYVMEECGGLHVKVNPPGAPYIVHRVGCTNPPMIPLLPSRAQLEAAGLSVWDGLKLIGDDAGNTDLWIDLHGEYYCTYYERLGGEMDMQMATGVLIPTDIPDLQTAIQRFTALLAWARLEADND